MLVNDSKRFYSYVRSKQRTKDKVGPFKDSAGENIVDDEVSANLLNDYFSSVFTLENTTNIQDPIVMFKGNLEIEGLLNIEITSDDVFKKLAEIKINKCPGLDTIHPKILFELKKGIS